MLLTWLLLALIPVAAIALRMLAGDDPRNDDPPDTGMAPAALR